MQKADTLAAKPTVDQLDPALRPLCKLRRQNFVSLFRRGVVHSASFPRDLAKLPGAGGDCVLDFRFLTHRGDIYRF